MKKTVTRMADGRALMYFDRDDAMVRDAVDRRDLPDVSTSGHARFDPLLREWVAVASHRQNRTYQPPPDQCPLCPTTGEFPTEIPDEDYEVVVFANRFPSFSLDAEPVGPGPSLAAEQDWLFTERPGRGRCEVVCFTSDHDKSFAELTQSEARLVIEAWSDRTLELGAMPGVEQVFCFENRGAEIGVTLDHPHGQIYGYPFVTPRTRTQLDSARAYREHTWRSLFGDLLDAERAEGSRVVVSGAHWTAFVPHAARWPVEVHLYPHRQVPDLPALTDSERDELAQVYLDVLGRLDRLYDAPLPYIAAWHQAPVRVDRDLAYLHLELFSIRRSDDKLKYLAGSESGMGAFITDTTAEDVAARLRSI